MNFSLECVNPSGTLTIFIAWLTLDDSCTAGCRTSVQSSLSFSARPRIVCQRRNIIRAVPAYLVVGCDSSALVATISLSFTPFPRRTRPRLPSLPDKHRGHLGFGTPGNYMGQLRTITNSNQSEPPCLGSLLGEQGRCHS